MQSGWVGAIQSFKTKKRRADSVHNYLTDRCNKTEYMGHKKHRDADICHELTDHWIKQLALQ